MPDIYLSIAVIPGREDKLERCLKTIMKQDVLPKKIFICTCKNYKRFPDKIYNKELHLNKYLEKTCCLSTMGAITQRHCPLTLSLYSDRSTLVYICNDIA